MHTHPFTRILLATEHTEFDIGAERVAVEMASKCGLPLMGVLPIVSNPEYETVAPDLAARDERAAAATAAKLRALAEAAGVQIAMHVRLGEEPYQEIVAEAKERGADLLVIRRRGKRSFLARLLLGEMVAKVLGHAPCSVLVVPRNSRLWQRGILVAVDDASPQNVAATAAAIALECDLPLTVVSIAESAHMQPEAEEVVARNVAVAEALGAKVEGRTRIGKPYEQILAATKDFGADLTVVGRGGKEGTGWVSVGSIMQKVAGHAEETVLIVRPPS
jgi:nucleotide-binding universal stress UspA family protein